MFRSSFKGISRGGNLSLWQREAGLWETSAREQRDSLKLALLPEYLLGDVSKILLGSYFAEFLFVRFCKKKKIFLRNIFCELKFDKSCCEFVLQNRRSRSACFVSVKFHFTPARQPVPKIVSLGREASSSSLTRICSYS